MGYVGELPGMYYDKEKRKYFKIQATGASPAASAYSSQDVKRRKLVDERTQAVERQALRQKGRVRRSILDPLTGGILRREYGEGKNSVNGPQILANRLAPQGSSKKAPTFGALFTVQPRVYHDTVVMIDLEIMYEDRLNFSSCSADFKKCYGEATEVFGHPGQSTSVSYHKERRTLIATWMAESSHSGIAIIPTGTVDERTPTIMMGPGRSHGTEVDILSSTAAPDSSPLLFAVGTSEGVISIDKEIKDVHFLPRKLFPEGHAKDVFALEFLSNDPSVLMSGGRSGILNITDLRVPDFGAQADFIRHSSSITHIKQLDDHRIIVAGLQSSLLQYDLRFRRTAARTQSILSYPEYHNKSTIRVGFDVDLETGVVAAAQEHNVNHPPLQLFSLHGGQALLPHSARESNPFADIRIERSDDIIPCVRFVRDHTDWTKSLYISADVIRRYSWG